MSEHFLGEHFDIHGGGQDLIFPHHENEIAQSEGAHGHAFVNYWVHNGFVRVDNEKMSKSLGNFFTVREVLAKFDPEVVRFFIVRAHYRSPLNYSDQHLDDARAGLTRLYTALRDTPPAAAAIDWSNAVRRALQARRWTTTSTRAEAIAVLFELASEVNRAHSSAADAGLLKALAGLLGLLQREPSAFLQGGCGGERAVGRADRGPHRAARGRAQGEEFRRGRPHSQGARGRAVSCWRTRRAGRSGAESRLRNVPCDARTATRITNHELKDRLAPRDSRLTPGRTPSPSIQLLARGSWRPASSWLMASSSCSSSFWRGVRLTGVSTTT